MEGMEGDVISMAELYARSASAFASTEVLPPLVSTGLVPTRFAVRGNRVSA
jgi:hypothetical protein